MKQIIDTTDGRFIGKILDFLTLPVELDGYLFVPDKVQHLSDGTIRYSNSNYVVDVKDI